MADNNNGLNILIKTILDSKNISSEIKKLQLLFDESPIKIKVDIDSKEFQNFSANIKKISKNIKEDTKDLMPINTNIANLDKYTVKFEQVAGQARKQTQYIKEYTSSLGHLVKEQNILDAKGQGVVKVLTTQVDNLKQLRNEQEKLNKAKAAAPMQNWAKQLEIDAQIRKGESDRLKNHMQINAQLDKQVQKLELYKQKMLGDGKGMKGELDIFASKNVGKFDDGALAKLKADIGDLNVASPNFQNNLDKIKLRFNSMQKAAADSGSTISKMLDNFLKFVRYYLVAGSVIKVISQFKDGVDQVKELDSAITNMRITMNLSNNDMDRMTDSARKLAKELGSTVKDVLGAAKTFANMSESIDAILEKTRANIMLSNLSGSGIEETVDSIQGIMNQFNLLEKDSMRIADTLTFISANLKMDFGKGIREITEGIKVSGTMAREAGFELEQYEAVLGSIIERTRLGGSTVGNALLFGAMVA